MTETIIMEELSKAYIEGIASRRGYFNSSGKDFGTDLTIRKAYLKPRQKNRYLTSGKAIDIQVKSVSEKYVTGLDDSTCNYIKYNLEVKNYNDLIDRFNEAGAIIPLLLIIVILPENKDEWLNLTVDSLILKKCAFWYQSPKGATHATNKSKSVITIPKSNQICLDFFDEQFSKLD